MALWFECKVRYDKTMENGAVKKVNEPYLVDALSFTEAEARIIEERTPYISGEFTVSAVKKTRIAEIFSDPAADDRYFMVKVNFITLDEKSGIEKKSASHILVQANDFPSALKRFNDGMAGSAADFEIASIAETPLLDVYQVKSPIKMGTIAENIINIKATLPKGVELVAVSKFNTSERIAEAYSAGQRIFGESRVQELLTKIKELPTDIRWHFIGHLQTNKVRQLVGNVAMIESVDSEKLLQLISTESKKKGVVTDILLQLHVAREETKFGFYPEELMTLIANQPWQQYTNVRFRGVMGMASNVEDTQRIHSDFQTIRRTFDEIKTTYNTELPYFDIVSMGMSGDRDIAIQCGSTMVRVGSAIFGMRMYADKK